ncbi:MAG: SGNH/GDSL hydrolase family protein [Ilumatobacteraceae bacterium]
MAGGQVRTAGIVELDASAGGLVLHRMPAWARAQHNDPSLPLLEAMPAGGRFEFRTNATVVELDVDLTLVQLGDAEAWPAVFELVVDGELVDRAATRAGTTIVIDPVTQAIEFVPGAPTTVRFELPGGDGSDGRLVEIWLPHAAAMRLLDLRADGSVEPPPESRDRTVRRWVHYGSSISHCIEADGPTGTWPAVAARLAGVDLQSLAFAGQCHLDQFAARMIGEAPADLISAKLGINVINGDTMRERTFVPALHGFLDTIRERHPDVPLLLITPITCPVAEDHPGPTTTVDGTCAVVERPPELSLGALTLERIRHLEREVVAARRANDPNLHLLEGTELFGPDDVADLPDGLHPNAAGYRRMGERFFARAFQGAGPFSA